MLAKDALALLAGVPALRPALLGHERDDALRETQDAEQVRLIEPFGQRARRFEQGRGAPQARLARGRVVRSLDAERAGDARRLAGGEGEQQILGLEICAAEWIDR